MQSMHLQLEVVPIFHHHRDGRLAALREKKGVFALETERGYETPNSV